MGERKVLNKYYPPDFDPAKIPRRKQPKNRQMKVRMMHPMSIRCNTCGNYMYKGTKFNSRKEDAIGETYLTIQIFIFYFKCTMCSAEIAYKTDPKNSGYVVEFGATQNFEPWRAKDEQVENEKRKRAAEEMGDAMKSLENRTLDSKQEMDILATLDEMKSMKSRQATVSVDAMLEALQQAKEENERKLKEEDEALIRSVFMGSIRRVNDEDIDDEEDLALTIPTIEVASNSISKRRKLDDDQSGNPTDKLTKASALGKENAYLSGSSNDGKLLFKSPLVRVSIKEKLLSESNDNIPRKVEETMEGAAHSETVGSNGLLALCRQYGSDEDDEL